MIGFLLSFDLGGNPHVTGVELAATADCTTNRALRHRTKANTVRTETDHFDHVKPSFHAAIYPEFHVVTYARHDQSTVSTTQSQFGWESCVLQGVRSSRTRTALEARKRNDIRTRLGDADGNRANFWNDRDFDADLGIRVNRFQFFNQLRQVFDAVKVVVVARRDQIHTRCCMTCMSHLDGDLAAGKMPTLARFCALTNFDFNKPSTVQHLARDTKTPTGNLLTAPTHVLANHVGNLAALAIHADHIEAFGGFWIGTKGCFALRAETHGANHKRQRVLTCRNINLFRHADFVFGAGTFQALDLEQIPCRNRKIKL